MTSPNYGCSVQLPQQTCLGSWLDPNWLPNQPMNIDPITHVFEIVVDEECVDGVCQEIPVGHHASDLYDLRGEELVQWHQQNLP